MRQIAKFQFDENTGELCYLLTSDGKEVVALEQAKDLDYAIAIAEEHCRTAEIAGKIALRIEDVVGNTLYEGETPSKQYHL